MRIMLIISMIIVVMNYRYCCVVNVTVVTIFYHLSLLHRHVADGDVSSRCPDDYSLLSVTIVRLLERTITIV